MNFFRLSALLGRRDTAANVERSALDNSYEVFRAPWFSQLLLDKLRKFLIQYAIIQSLPFAIILLICLAGNELDKFISYFQYREIVLLGGFAWLTLPSFIKEHALHRQQAALYSRRVFAIGMMIIIGTLVIDARAYHHGDLLIPESWWLPTILLFLVVNVMACFAVIAYAHRAGLVRARIGLSWRHGGEFAPLYLGVMTGEFEKRGIRMELVPLKQGEEAIRRVTESRVDFEIVSAVSLVCHAGENPRLTSVMALYPTAPVCFVSGSRRIQISDLKGASFTLGYSWTTYKQIFALLKRQNRDIACRLSWSHKPVADVPLNELSTPDNGFRSAHSDGGFDAVICYEHLDPSLVGEGVDTVSSNELRYKVSVTTLEMTVPGEVVVCTHSLLGAFPQLANSCLAGLWASYQKFVNDEAIRQSLHYCRKVSSRHASDELAARWLATGIDGGDMLLPQTDKMWRDLTSECEKAGLITPEAAARLSKSCLYFESFLRLRDFEL